MGKPEILIDAHTHVGTEEEREEREKKGIVSLVCASVPEEARMICSGKWKYLIPTCGVHPWYADRQRLEDMEPWMEKCPVIGEIGMDSVWCTVPLSVQEDVFRRQLFWAGRQKKPVILHTKGQEQHIASVIREYPNRYLVHWYSCEDYLEEYMDQDCYFSIGPDVGWNQAVARVVKNVPWNRLFIETDGMEAVKWAYDEIHRKDETKGSAEAALWTTLKTVADLLGMDAKEVGKKMKENLMSGFLCSENPHK